MLLMAGTRQGASHTEEGPDKPSTSQLTAAVPLFGLCSRAQMRAFVLKFPLAFSFKPSHVRGAVERLQQLCFTRDEWAREYQLAMTPSLMAYFIKDMGDQLRRFEYLASTGEGAGQENLCNMSFGRGDALPGPTQKSSTLTSPMCVLHAAHVCLHLPWGRPRACCTAAVAGERLEWRLRDVMKQADRTFRAKTKNFAVWEARVKARRAQQRSGAQAARAAAVQQQQQSEADAIKAAILAADKGQQLAAGMAQQGLPQQQGFWQQQAQQPPQPPQQQW